MAAPLYSGCLEMSKDVCEKVLQQDRYPRGTFILRRHNPAGSLILSVRDEVAGGRVLIKHNLIDSPASGVSRCAQQQFISIDALIQFFSSNKLLGCQLGKHLKSADLEENLYENSSFGASVADEENEPVADIRPVPVPKRRGPYEDVNPENPNAKPPDVSFQDATILYDFEPKPQDHGLSVKQGDKIQASFEHFGWLYCRKGSEEGYVPKTFLQLSTERAPTIKRTMSSFERPLHESGEDLNQYYMPVSQVVAHELLKRPNYPKGTFLLRPSAEQGMITLSVRNFGNEIGQVLHYRIVKEDNLYFIERVQKFSTIIGLVEHYQENPSDHLCCQLKRPFNEDETHSESGPFPFSYNEIPEHDLETHDQPLGRGSFGTVYKAKWVPGAKIVAVKIIHDENMDNVLFLKEAKAMHMMRHPRLVQLIGICSKEGKKWIVTEFMQKGALLIYIKKCKRDRIKLTYSQHIKMAQQVSEGMAYLEEQNFIHRDLRSANVLVDDMADLKIADFGLAKLNQGIYIGTKESTQYPVRWAAPEIMDRLEFSNKSDVWSYSILLWEILTYGKRPYEKIKTSELKAQILNNRRLDKPDDCPTSIFALMTRCWQKEPTDRPSFAQILQELNNMA